MVRVLLFGCRWVAVRCDDAPLVLHTGTTIVSVGTSAEKPKAWGAGAAPRITKPFTEVLAAAVAAKSAVPAQ